MQFLRGVSCYLNRFTSIALIAVGLLYARAADGQNREVTYPRFTLSWSGAYSIEDVNASLLSAMSPSFDDTTEPRCFFYVFCSSGREHPINRWIPLSGGVSAGVRLNGFLGLEVIYHGLYSGSVIGFNADENLKLVIKADAVVYGLAVRYHTGNVNFSVGPNVVTSKVFVDQPISVVDQETLPGLNADFVFQLFPQGDRAVRFGSVAVFAALFISPERRITNFEVSDRITFSPGKITTSAATVGLRVRLHFWPF